MTSLRELLMDADHLRNEAEELERQARWHRTNFRLEEAAVLERRAALFRADIPEIGR